MARCYLGVGTAVLIGLPTATQAADAVGWTHALTPFFIGAQISGDASVGSQSVDVDVPFHDVLDNLDGALMLRYRGETGPWSITGDVVYLSLEKSGRAADVELDQVVGELVVGYRLGVAEVFAGIRYTDLDVSADGQGPLGIGFDDDESFWDPVVGARTVVALSGPWHFQAEADVGGADMDLTWRAMAHVGYRFSDRYSLWFGYQALGQDFDDAGSQERYGQDVTYHGVSGGFSVTF